MSFVPRLVFYLAIAATFVGGLFAGIGLVGDGDYFRGGALIVLGSVLAILLGRLSRLWQRVLYLTD